MQNGLLLQYFDFMIRWHALSLLAGKRISHIIITVRMNLQSGPAKWRAHTHHSTWYSLRTHTHTMAWIRYAKPSVYSANLRWNRIWSSRISQFTSHRAQPKCSALAPAPIRTQTHSTNKCESRRMDRKLIDVEILELERLTWTKTTCCDVIDRHVMTSVKSTHSASDTVRSLHAVGSVRIHVSEP